MEFLVRDFVSFHLSTGFLHASTVQRAVQKVKGDILERDTDMSHIDLEGYLRELGLGITRFNTIHLVLFFHGFVCLLLRLLMLSFGPYTDCF